MRQDTSPLYKIATNRWWETWAWHRRKTAVKASYAFTYVTRVIAIKLGFLSSWTSSTNCPSNMHYTITDAKRSLDSVQQWDSCRAWTAAASAALCAIAVSPKNQCSLTMSHLSFANPYISIRNTFRSACTLPLQQQQSLLCQQKRKTPRPTMNLFE